MATAKAGTPKLMILASGGDPQFQGQVGIQQGFVFNPLSSSDCGSPPSISHPPGKKEHNLRMVVTLPSPTQKDENFEQIRESLRRISEAVDEALASKDQTRIEMTTAAV